MQSLALLAKELLKIPAVDLGRPAAGLSGYHGKGINILREKRS